MLTGIGHRLLPGGFSHPHVWERQLVRGDHSELLFVFSEARAEHITRT